MKKELVKRLRERLGPLPLGTTDAQLLEATKGTLMRQGIELQLSIERFAAALGDSFKELNESLEYAQKALSKFGASAKQINKNSK